MNKSEVEQILVLVKAGQEVILNLKIYKNGLLCRNGYGGLPPLNISGMSFTDKSDIFDRFMEKIPQEAIEQSVNHQDQVITSPVEYIVAFYGISKNGDTGERAEWTKSTGIRFLLDNDSKFRHPLLSFVDGTAIAAVNLTNSWYFDIIIMATHNLKSNALPEKTIVSSPKTGIETQKAFADYINSIDKSELQNFVMGKIFSDKSGVELKLEFKISNNSVRYDFIPVGIRGLKFADLGAEVVEQKNSTRPEQEPGKNTSAKSEKKWWKLW